MQQANKLVGPLIVLPIGFIACFLLVGDAGLLHTGKWASSQGCSGRWSRKKRGRKRKRRRWRHYFNVASWCNWCCTVLQHLHGYAALCVRVHVSQSAANHPTRTWARLQTCSLPLLSPTLPPLHHPKERCKLGWNLIKSG